MSDSGIKQKKCTRAVGWLVVINNYSEEELELFKWWSSKNCDYACYSLEEGKKCHTPHIQGYVHYKNKLSFNTLKKVFPRAYLEKADGSAEDNRRYCSKKNTQEVFEIGKKPKQGKRNDLNSVRNAIDNGGSLNDILHNASNVNQIRFAEMYLRHNERERTEKPYVIWLWGPTGCGKTTTAIEMADGKGWWSGKNLKWWQGYDAHKIVILDDFRADFCTYHELLRILDKAPYTIECKGGSRQLLAECIIITSCYPPDKVYNTREDIGQLLRRIDQTIEMPRSLILCPEVSYVIYEDPFTKIQ